MRSARIRAQLGKPDPSNYRRYESHYESALDFLHYLHYMDFPTDITTPKEYVQKLKNLKYFEDSENNYLTGLESWI